MANQLDNGVYVYTVSRWNNDKTISTIFCSPGKNSTGFAVLLLKSYSTADKVEALVNLGDLIIVGNTASATLDYNEAALDSNHNVLGFYTNYTETDRTKLSDNRCVAWSTVNYSREWFQDWVKGGSRDFNLFKLCNIKGVSTLYAYPVEIGPKKVFSNLHNWKIYLQSLLTSIANNSWDLRPLPSSIYNFIFIDSVWYFFVLEPGNITKLRKIIM